MPPPPARVAASAPAATRGRPARFAAFLAAGLPTATWVSRTPDIRGAVEASTARMGLVVGGLSVGSMPGIAVPAPS